MSFPTMPLELTNDSETELSCMKGPTLNVLVRTSPCEGKKRTDAFVPACT